ncbi:MAG: UDP-N-acetylmuramoyl-L-alanine--D-glutamate ligase [Actinomycetota bacterium]|nr:UDP-N-acetylmuramoyl-L-alanine--D-glutamate ligase [Actinomycetota bacterium]
MRRLSGDILVVGLGRSGAAVVRYLLSCIVHGDSITITAVDGEDTPELLQLAEEYRAVGVRVELGCDRVDGHWGLGIVSPGIPPGTPLHISAVETCDETIGELELAFRMSSSPWVAVTGTNGKTTVTSLASHLLECAGTITETVGNIGNPAIDIVEEAAPEAAIVAEVSSFQLHLVTEFHPRVAVLLNITPDHIDWHGSMAAYTADKTRIFERMGAGDTAVIDVDDAGAAPYASEVELQGVRVVRVSRMHVPAGGAGLDGGMLVLDTDEGRVELIPARDLRIKGDHNISNALAAAAAAHAFGADATALREGLASFAPIEHRIESVTTVGEVEYFNDSKATNPGAVLMALSAFRDRPVVLLLGGRNKDNLFDEIAEAARSCRGVVAFGEAADEIVAAFDAAGTPVVGANGLADATRIAHDLALPGDAVLLSPACASFDEFSGYAERGRTFKRMVLKMAEERRA